MQMIVTFLRGWSSSHISGLVLLCVQMVNTYWWAMGSFEQQVVAFLTQVHLLTCGDFILPVSPQACAPLYQWSTPKFSDRETVGTCYLKKGGKIVEYSPCRTCMYITDVLTKIAKWIFVAISLCKIIIHLVNLKNCNCSCNFLLKPPKSNAFCPDIL